MKKIVTVLILFCFGSGLFAHDINYENVILHTWVIKKENKSIEGSFYMLKNGIVFIEDSQHAIQQFPLALLSEQDRNFVLQKTEKIRQINKHLLTPQNGMVAPINNYNYPFGVIIFTLLLLYIYILRFANKAQLKYLLPIVSIGSISVFSAFTQKTIGLLTTTTTDPSFINSAFAPFIPNVHTHFDTNYFYVESTGIPTTHGMMTGISDHGWQRQVPIPQCYTGSNAWPIPLNPVPATTPIPVDNIHFTRGAIALAVNGVPIFNVHTNTGIDSYLDGQLDNYGGHCGRADDYHYHIAPLHLYNYTTTNLPIAFGLDGYAVYGSVEPNGSPMAALDNNHGHIGTDGIYHYHGTETAPYMIAQMAGQVTEDATHQLVPQAASTPIRPALTPLDGALITSCTPNANNDGYNLTYTKNGVIDSVVYHWNATGTYTFSFYTNGALDSTKVYNSFQQCTVCTLNPTITGYANACNNNSYTYTVAPVAGSTYIWTATGGNIISGQGTNSIVVQWNGGSIGTVYIEQTIP